MESRMIDAAMGRIPFDLAVRNVRLVNVLTQEIYPADLGIIDGAFSYVGRFEDCHSAKETVDAANAFAVPGLIDSHMHIESSMMTPAHFAEAVLPMGTTTVAADPHEIGNVLGTDGVRMICGMSRGLPLHVHVMAPSTIPSAPGFETSGADITGKEVAEMLSYPGILGLGEVMDFLGVVAADERMLKIIEAGKRAGVLLDGHLPTLRGKELTAFAASGIDCDHTYMDCEIVAEKLRRGFCVQIQERFFTPALMAFLNALPVQNRVMLVTDDVPIVRLAKRGHLGSLVRRAIEMGLDPLRAYRFVTINPADRLRLYDRGAIAPGRRADLLLLDSLEAVSVHSVFCDGQLVAKAGQMLSPLESAPFSPQAYQTMRLSKLSEADFAISCSGERALVHVMMQDGIASRTKLERRECAVRDEKLLQGTLVKMAVFERHTGKAGRSLGLIGNLEEFHGALATTYAHDCHNLAVYSSNDIDAALAANAVIEMGGGVAAVADRKLLCAIALPIAGILCEDRMLALAAKFEKLDEAAKQMRLNHQEPLTFMTLMPLAVSPEVKLTDRGLLDVVTKTFLPLVIETY